MVSPDDPLGHVALQPSGPIVAGTVGQWTLTYTVGSYGIDEGGTIKVARRFASDWERPQFDRPGDAAYTTVTTTGDAKVRARFDPKAHVRPWMKCVVIDIYDGCLAPGDLVTVVFGDRRDGSPGIRAQSFIESAHEMRVLVDPTNACLVRRLESSPVVSVIAGDPVRPVAIVPTTAVVERAVEIFVKGEDRWGNPTPAPDGVQLHWEGDATVTMGDRQLIPTAPGHGRVIATVHTQTGDGGDFPSNPITVYAEPPRYGRYWADLHAQSDATVGTGTEQEYFTFGRDHARLDVMSHQGNDFQVTDEDWRRLGETTARFHQDGRFVVFPGYEWSANTPAGGDRNVIYLEEGLPIFRSSHWQVPEVAVDDRTPAHPADALYRRLHDHVDPNKVLVASHCGGRYADIRKYFDPTLEPLVEVASCWGVFEWLLWDAFDKGYRVGVMCNSDGHKGRPGAEGPGAGQFGIYGGLTCILAESLTRAAVFDALKQRRCYGTTGPRIDLGFTVDGQPMGSEITATGSVKVQASVRGTAPIEALVVYRGKEVVEIARPPSFAAAADSPRIRVIWGGARIRGRGRRAIWDGRIEVEGARIQRVETVAFDSPADGIERWSPQEVHFRSRTTGDIDGLDLWLDQGHTGHIGLRTEVGTVDADLSVLDTDGTAAHFGGLGLHATIARYPEAPTQTAVELQTTVDVASDTTTPIFVKAIQTDGQMAWSSPVYVG